MIIEKPEEQWWSARNKHGQVGMLPVPFVRKLVRFPLQGKHYEKSKLEVKDGTRKSTNMSKMTEILQRPEELPTELYERLCNAFRVYIPSDLFNPDTRENQYMVNAAFVAQSFADIHCKFQKVEGLAEMNNTQLLEVANKVFENRDQEPRR